MVLAAIQFLASRHEVNPDGISYLDLAEQYSKGQWSDAVNPYWSPAYPLLLGIAMRAFGPFDYWEAAVAHLINIAIVVAILAAFEFFVRSLTDTPGGRGASQDSAPPGTTTATVALGYALILWGMFRLSSVGLITPDGCVAAAVLVAAALLCRIHWRGPTWPRFAALGGVLGLGYLAKAVIFPLAPFFIAAGVLSSRSAARGLRGGLIALAVFVVIAIPQVIAVSGRVGKFSFGESKAWTYAYVVNGMTNTAFWTGQAPEAGTALAPAMILHDDPVVHGYQPIRGATYPFWYDAPRWLAGLDPPVRLGNQARAIVDHLRLYGELALAIWLPVLALCFAGRFSRTDAARVFRSHGALALPAVVALGTYALVHVEGRYVFPFIVVAALIAFDALRRNVTGLSPQFYRAVALATSVALIVVTLAYASTGPAAALQQLSSSRSAAHPHWAAAQALRAMGAQDGDPVAYVGDSYYAYWARLAGVHIIAELRGDASSIWADSAKRDTVLRAFARAGARHVVAERLPSWMSDSRWRRLGATEYYVYRASP